MDYQAQGSSFPSDPGKFNLLTDHLLDGFNPNDIWVKGMTVLARTGGDNGREIAQPILPQLGMPYQWQKEFR